jgi:ammonia channel protein AmtB
MLGHVPTPSGNVAYAIEQQCWTETGGNESGNVRSDVQEKPNPTTASTVNAAFTVLKLSFATISAALVSGAIADRARFAAWMLFVPVSAVAVYAVVAHWVWARGGWLFELGIVNYAGGLAVEIVSGASALALALVLGPRMGLKTPSTWSACTTSAAWSASFDRTAGHRGDDRPVATTSSSGTARS